MTILKMFGRFSLERAGVSLKMHNLDEFWNQREWGKKREGEEEESEINTGENEWS